MALHLLLLVAAVVGSVSTFRAEQRVFGIHTWGLSSQKAIGTTPCTCPCARDHVPRIRPRHLEKLKSLGLAEGRCFHHPLHTGALRTAPTARSRQFHTAPTEGGRRLTH